MRRRPSPCRSLTPRTTSRPRRGPVLWGVGRPRRGTPSRLSDTAPHVAPTEGGRAVHDARREWATEHALTARQTFGLVPSRAAYSASHLAATGREDRARALLGVLAADIFSARLKTIN